MLWRWPRGRGAGASDASRRPASLDSVASSIRQSLAAARPRTDPFPHLIVDDLLPRWLVGDMVARWPEADMTQEGRNSTRRWTPLVGGNSLYTPLLTEHARYWDEVVQRVLLTWIGEVFQAFLPFFAARIGAAPQGVDVGQLVLMDSRRDFVEHGAHSHYDHGPDWLFTSLIYLEDCVDAERGTVLYGVEGLDPSDDAQYFSLVANDFGSHRLVERVDSGFAPGRMLAFVDGPTSIHGSRRADAAPRVEIGRRVVRTHVKMTDEDVERAFGMGGHARAPSPFHRASVAFRETRDPSAFAGLGPCYTNDRHLVSNGWRVAETRRTPPRFTIDSPHAARLPRA